MKEALPPESFTFFYPTLKSAGEEKGTFKVWSPVLGETISNIQEEGSKPWRRPPGSGYIRYILNLKKSKYPLF